MCIKVCLLNEVPPMCRSFARHLLGSHGKWLSDRTSWLVLALLLSARRNHFNSPTEVMHPLASCTRTARTQQ